MCDTIIFILPEDVYEDQKNCRSSRVRDASAFWSRLRFCRGEKIRREQDGKRGTKAFRPNQHSGSQRKNKIPNGGQPSSLPLLFAKTDGFEPLVQAMDMSGVQGAIIFGMPMAKQWDAMMPKAPTYYLSNDSHCYYYSGTDFILAHDLMAQPKEVQERFYPFICGVNGNDQFAAEQEFNLKLVHLLERYGYEVFLPQRDGYLATELENMTEEEKLKKIFDKDESEVLKADIIFTLLDGRAPDEGACVELGIAYAAG